MSRPDADDTPDALSNAVSRIGRRGRMGAPGIEPRLRVLAAPLSPNVQLTSKRPHHMTTEASGCPPHYGPETAPLLAFVADGGRLSWLSRRPVTPEVAGSSPVAPVYKSPRKAPLLRFPDPMVLETGQQ